VSFQAGKWSQFVGERYEPLVRSDLKLFGLALPLHRNPAFYIAKFSRDPMSVFPAAKRRKSFFSRGLTYGMS
jgi:hypothetical protein